MFTTAWFPFWGAALLILLSALLLGVGQLLLGPKDRKGQKSHWETFMVNMLHERFDLIDRLICEYDKGRDFPGHLMTAFRCHSLAVSLHTTRGQLFQVWQKARPNTQMTEKEIRDLSIEVLEDFLREDPGVEFQESYTELKSLFEEKLAA